MNIAMMGLIKGFAEGTTERIKKEREDEEALIANRFKMAALNKRQREEEAKVQKEAAKSRLDRVETLFPGASLEQKLALVSNESMFQIAEQQMLKEGDLDLDKFIVVNKEKIPPTFKTAQDYVNSITARPQGEMKMPEQQTKEVFFANVSPSAGRQQALASQFGATAEELYAYEGLTSPIEAPVFGSVNLEILKKPDSVSDRLEKLRASLADAPPDQAPAIEERIIELEAIQQVGLEPKTLVEQLNKLSLLKLKAPKDQQKAIQAKIDEVNSLIKSNTLAQKEAEKAGDDKLTFTQRLRAVESAQVAALESMTGLDAVKKDRLIEKYKDPETQEERVRLRRLKPTDLPEIRAITRSTAIQALKDMGQIRPDGTITEHGKVILISLGLYQNGKIIPDPVAEAKAENARVEEERARLQAERDKAKGGTTPPTTEVIPQAATQEEFNARWATLEPGEKLKGPDGKVYIKKKKQ